ncbi:DNA cytosine methyltransferase [Paenibacillus polymyxa]|uniref:DNA cytosine methyltransferase n=1 Tax=Paenibacillus polymyxa TaxID=1406 RepID=UPI0008D7E174|nr:DNA cytosine methyltransferase [Paenibacillus polymyxa]SEJ39704.1 DNA (cytosine-5)-methyltransferase 1 [Paenibacillus polymyxa]
MKPLAIDLFCGAGGMSEGILQAGFHIVFSSDINEDVERTYTNRHEQLSLKQGVNTFFHRSDIRELESDFIRSAIKSLEIFKGRTNMPTIDAIFGGPPCQGFSRAGQRKKDDPRNMLFKEYLRIINDIRPSYVVMENVEGFTDTRLDGFIGVKDKLYPDNSLVPEILKEEFIEIGYRHLEPRILDASDYGVPQRRKRVIFIAYLEDKPVPSYPEAITPNEEDKITVQDAIADLIISTNRVREFSQYQKESIKGRTLTVEGTPVPHFGEIYNHDVSRHNALIMERFSLFKEGESTSMLVKRLLDEGLDLENYPLLFRECTVKLEGVLTQEQILNKFREKEIDEVMLEALLTKKSNRFRLSRNGTAPTMVTLPDDFLTPFENRIPTVREMARLQSFDDSFVFLGKRTTGGPRRKVEVPQYTQVGNAVPPLLARAIASRIIAAIEAEVHLTV